MALVSLRRQRFANGWILPAQARSLDMHSAIVFSFDDELLVFMLESLIRLSRTGQIDPRACSSPKKCPCSLLDRKGRGKESACSDLRSSELNGSDGRKGGSMSEVSSSPLSVCSDSDILNVRPIGR